MSEFKLVIEDDNKTAVKQKADDVISFDTSKALEIKTEKPKNIIPLVPEYHPILKEVMPEFDFSAPPVNPNELASALVDTCIENKGYGLSANQCGFRYRVFVMGAADEYVAFFNPKLLATRGEVHMEEACLSFPLLNLFVTRPAEIDVEYQDFNGLVKKATFNGISARCWLHELDHMNGIVYTQKVKPLALANGMKRRMKTLGKLGYKFKKIKK
jgi:peptide deformylase